MQTKYIALLAIVPSGLNNTTLLITKNIKFG